MKSGAVRDAINPGGVNVFGIGLSSMPIHTNLE